MLGRTECITSKGIAQTYSGTDIARSNLIDIFAVIGMHTQEASDALCLAFGAILNRGTLARHTGIDAQVGKTANEGIGNDLEDQRAERRIVLHGASFCLLSL